jgi:ADP-ribose pyrophosphatase YjhB (NUDIX family)
MIKTVPETAILVPDGAHKVFKGQIFDVYQWPQQTFDGRTATFEMLRRPDTLQVLAVNDGKIAVVKDEQPHSGPHYKLPGGRLDDTDKSWLAAAQRELREETGLAMSNWKLINVEQSAPKIEQFVPVFLATGVESQVEQQLDAGGERISVEWWDFDRLRSTVLAGKEVWLGYHGRLFVRTTSLDDLLSLPEFAGKQVDR